MSRKQSARLGSGAGIPVLDPATQQACEALAATMMPENSKRHLPGTLVAFDPVRADYVTADTEIELIRKFEAKFGKEGLGWFDEVGRGRRQADNRDR